MAELKMADAISTRIQSELTSLEQSEDIVILLAVESGSRAWGFPSLDSDFDVRFIYLHHRDWYLSIDEHRDVIEKPILDNLDISGWDIRKALKLFQKSNPPLLEWLQCPIVYREQFSFANQLRALLPAFYSPKACFFHYLHMARGNVREYLHGDLVWQKKYFYVLRPLLAMRWIEESLGPVPIEFGRLVEATIHDMNLRQEIDRLVDAKKAGVELDRGPRIPAISCFIEAEMDRLESKTADSPTVAPPVDKLNDLFRDTLAEVWNK
jgi:uncharacterized protein